MNRYQATDSAGVTHARTAKAHVYSHAVVATITMVHENWPTEGERYVDNRKIVSWAGTPALAASRAESLSRKGFDVEVIEAVTA